MQRPQGCCRRDSPRASVTATGTQRRRIPCSWRPTAVLPNATSSCTHCPIRGSPSFPTVCLYAIRRTRASSMSARTRRTSPSPSCSPPRSWSLRPRARCPPRREVTPFKLLRQRRRSRRPPPLHRLPQPPVRLPVSGDQSGDGEPGSGRWGDLGLHRYTSNDRLAVVDRLVPVPSG